MPARPLVAARDSPPHGCPSRPNDSSPPGGARPHPHSDGDRVGNGARVAVGSGGCPQRYGCTEPAGQFRHRPGDQLSAGHTFGAEAADAGEDPAAFGPGAVFRLHHRHVHILPGIALNTRLSVRDGSAGGTGAGFRVAVAAHPADRRIPTTAACRSGRDALRTRVLSRAPSSPRRTPSCWRGCHGPQGHPPPDFTLPRRIAVGWARSVEAATVRPAASSAGPRGGSWSVCRDGVGCGMSGWRVSRCRRGGARPGCSPGLGVR